MKKFILFILIFLFFSFQSTFADSPILLFSDMESAPNSGWSSSELNKWASVTIWWRNLWDTRWTSYVTVNWVDLKSDSDYAVWWEYWPTPQYQKITFWLNDTMHDWPWEITLTIAWNTSNSLPFTIRDWNIYFVSDQNTWLKDWSLENPFYQQSLTRYWKFQWFTIKPWDIFYFREWTYSKKWTWNNAVLRIDDVDWTQSHPISIIWYPWEKPLIFQPTIDVNFKNGVSIWSNHIVFSWFKMDVQYMAMNILWGYVRIIWNDIEAMKGKYFAWTGMIISTSDWLKVFWNYFHDATSKWRFDHVIYVWWCSANKWSEIWWNYMINNDFWNWTLMVVNHQEGRCPYETKIVKAHFIFNNYIQCADYRWTWVWIYDLSYDTWEVEPEPTYVYNNIIDGCWSAHYNNPDSASYPVDSRWYATAVSHSNWHARFYNNIISNSWYRAFTAINRSTAPKIILDKTYESLRLSTIFKNNIVTMNPWLWEYWNDWTYLSISSWDSTSTYLSNNLYYWIWEYKNCSNCIEDNFNISNMWPRFISMETWNFNLSPISPVIDSWTSDIVFEVSPPSYAPIDIDFYWNKREWIYDIWAAEWEPVSCLVNSDCSDWLFCNWEEKCADNICVSWVAPSLADDGLSCTISMCIEDTDDFVNTTNDSLCNDWDSNTTDTCSLTLWCQNIPMDIWTWDTWWGTWLEVPLPTDLLSVKYDITWDTEIKGSTFSWLWDRSLINFKQWVLYRFNLKEFSIPEWYEFYSAKLILYTDLQFKNLWVHSYLADKPWVEWDSIWSSSYGATRDYYDYSKKLSWDNYLGDWLDRNAVKNGSWFYDKTILIDTDSWKFVEIDLTNIFSFWVNWDILSLDNWIYLTQDLSLRNTLNSPKWTFYSKEHSNSLYHPKLELSFSKLPLVSEQAIPSSDLVILEPVTLDPIPQSTPTSTISEPTLTIIPSPEPISSEPTPPSTWWWWGWGWWSFTPIVQCTDEELKCKLVPGSTTLYKVYKTDWSFCQSELLWETCRPDTFNTALTEIEDIEEREVVRQAWNKVSNIEIYKPKLKALKNLAKKLDRLITKKRKKQLSWELLEVRNNLLQKLEVYIEVYTSKQKPSIKKLKLKILKRNIRSTVVDLVELIK